MQEKRRSRGKTPRQRQIENRRRMRRVLLILVGIVVVIFMAKCFRGRRETSSGRTVAGEVSGRPELDVQLLTKNEYSRPGISLNQVNGIVIHYTANPGSSAQANRDYFENLQYTQATSASSHFIVGLDGEIIQCIPTAEIAYASNECNDDTVSIETCHPDDTGRYTEATYDSLVHLTAWLCKKFGLTSEQVIRHYDVTGKICPKYFVEDEEAWEQFKADVDMKIEDL